jgi:hypothetical protein
MTERISKTTPEWWEQAAGAYYSPEPNTGCWLWFRSLDSRGYGNSWHGNAHWKAHRLAWLAYRGPIPDGLELDHICRVRSCVNPSHLRAVTGKENTLAGISVSAVNAKKTHCIRGHELSGDNLGSQHEGKGRKCLRCATTRGGRYYRDYREARRINASK